MKKQHWTQTPEGRARMSQIQTLSRKKMQENRKHKEPKKSKHTTLIINGWRVTLSKNEVRIDND